MANLRNAPCIEFLDLLMVDVGNEYFAKERNEVALNDLDIIFELHSMFVCWSCQPESVSQLKDS